MSGEFQVAGGTVIGRDHVLLGRNSQDALCWSATSDATVAVVADGCGSGRYSEVGAQIGARVLVEALRGRATALDVDAPHDVLERVRLDVLAHLRVLANAMGGRLSQVVSDYFLFTTLGFVLTQRTAVLFGIGDGLVGINGATRLLQAEDNAPPYLAYGLTPSSVSDDPSHFVVYDHRPASGVTSVVIATDGAVALVEGAPEAGLAEFWESDRYFANPYTIGRRLNQLSKTVRRPEGDARGETPPPRLSDDTTLVVARRNRR